MGGQRSFDKNNSGSHLELGLLSGCSENLLVQDDTNMFQPFSFLAAMLLTFVSVVQASIVLAWNVGPRLQDAFNGTVIKQVLSIFITASILRLIQGKSYSLEPLFCRRSFQELVEIENWMAVITGPNNDGEQLVAKSLLCSFLCK